MKHRTHQQWQELFKQQVTGGLSVAVFCKEHGIGQSYFYKRKSDLNDNETNNTQLHFPSTISSIWLANFVKALA